MFESWKKSIRNEAVSDIIDILKSKRAITYNFTRLGLSLKFEAFGQGFDIGYIAYSKIIDGLRSRRLLPGPERVVVYDRREKEGVSCWFILGILPTNDEAAIKAAYKHMAFIYHPDKGGNDGAFRSLENAKDKALQLARRR